MTKQQPSIENPQSAIDAQVLPHVLENSKPAAKVRSLNRQILLVAIISVAGFALYTGISSLALVKNADILEQIEDRNYPLQAHVLSALHSLEFIHSDLEAAVITGDTELLEATQPGAFKFNLNMENAASVSPLDAQELALIKEKFDLYYSVAYELASDMMGPVTDYETLVESGRRASENYESLVTQLKAFQSIQDSALSSSITEATDQATRSVIFLSVVGILTALVLLLVALRLSRSVVGRINEMVDSLRTIAQEGGDMSVRISSTGNDEMSELAHWFNTFIMRLEYVTNKSTEDIKKIAYTDFLSNLPNRRRLIEFLKSEIEYSETSGGHIVVFMMDLDNFKAINDEYGHDAGDDVIKDVAVYLNSIICGKTAIESKQYIDISHGQSVVGRLGGDEFMAVIPGSLHKMELANIAQAICDKLSQPFMVDGVQCRIGVSIGISQYPNDTTELIDLIGFADMAMYEAKLGGKNNHCFFNQSIADKFNHSNRILSALKDCIDANEFNVVYQPKFNLNDNSYNGAEALIRWNSKELGFIPPDVFIGLAEQSDLILEIDAWILNAVCAQIADWRSRGVDTKRIAINVSARQITLKGYVEHVIQVAKKHNVDTSLLEIEITETSALGDIDILKENIRQLRAHSINVAMDDFGAGHSSLQLLINCQIDTLKIDKALIDQIEDDHRSLSVVDSLVNLSRYLGIKSVAEGVEYERQRYLLQNVIKCDVAQGYLFAKPMHPDELVDVINKSGNDENQVA